MRKVLAVASIILFLFWSLAIFTLWRYRQEMFQVKSRLFVWTLIAIKLFFLMVHYSLGLPPYINIAFVIIQEYFKISAFLYVVFYYIKQAVNYTAEEGGIRMVKTIGICLLVFDFALAATLTTWAVLRLTDVFDTLPWRDLIWLAYRSVTLLLIISVVTVGVVIQRKVMKKSNELKMSLNATNIQRKEFIVKSLKQMWISFSMILFVSCFDVAYNAYWQVKAKPQNCADYTNNDLLNAFMFLAARSISLLLPFFPVMHCFIGRELLTVLLCCCCRKFKKKKHQEFYESKTYSDLE